MKFRKNTINKLLVGYGMMVVCSQASAHTTYNNSTLTNGFNDYVARQALRNDIPLTVTSTGAQSGASAGIGAVSGAAANGKMSSSFSNVGGVTTSRYDTTVAGNFGWIDGADSAANDVGGGCGVAGQPTCQNIPHGARIFANDGRGGNSHRVKFFGFELSQASNVSIQAEAMSNFVYTPFGATSPQTALGDLTPSISLYKGWVPHLSHDYAAIPVDYTGDGNPDPYDINTGNEGHLDTSTVPGAVPLYSWDADGNGINQKGVFYATQDMTMFNNQWERYNIAGLQADFTAGNTSVDWDNNGIIDQADVEHMAPQIGSLKYLGHTANTTDATSALWSGFLDPGIYSFVVGGSNASSIIPFYSGYTCGTSDPANCISQAEDATGRGLRVNFTASAVPIPGAVWLFGSALAGLVGLRRKRSA